MISVHVIQSKLYCTIPNLVRINETAAELDYSFILLNLFKYKISISVSNTVNVITSKNKKTALKSILSPITEAEIE